MGRDHSLDPTSATQHTVMMPAYVSSLYLINNTSSGSHDDGINFNAATSINSELSNPTSFHHNISF